MRSLADFPITRRWPARDPSVLQFYSFPTPNGVKVSIMLEEIGLPYEAHAVKTGEGETHTPEFLSLNPNNKIPAIIDPDGPGGAPIGLFESGAILVYLAEKTGQMLPTDPAGRFETLQWLMLQMAGIGPMFGQLGFFTKFGGKDFEDKRPRDRYAVETRRLLRVLDGRLSDGRDWIMGDYSIVDVATGPWLRMPEIYGALDLVEWESVPHVDAFLKRFRERPAVQRGVRIPPRDG